MKTCINLVDTSTELATQPATVAYDTSYGLFISVTFTGLPSNKRYRLRVKDCLGVTISENSANYMFFQPYTSYITYSTAPASPVIYNPSASFNFLQFCTLGARTDTSFLDSSIDNSINTSSSLLYYDPSLSKLKFEINWGGEKYNMNLSSITVSGISYYFRNTLFLSLQKTGNTVVDIPFVGERLFYSAFEWVGTSYRPYVSQYMTNQELQEKFDAFLRGDYDDILITTDPVGLVYFESITTTPSDYGYEYLQVFTVEELVSVVSTYVAKFIKGSRTEIITYTGYGFRLSVQDSSSPEYILCPRNSLRNNYIQEDNVYHYLQYTDGIYELNSFDQTNIQFDLGASFNVSSEMFADKFNTFQFVNSFNSSSNGIKVQLIDDVVQKDFYKNHYFVNGYLRNIVADIIIIPKDMVGDSTTGLFMTRENFVKQVSCSNEYGSDIGYQLAYFINKPENYSIVSLPGYKERLGQSGVTFHREMFSLSYNNNNYYKKASIEIDRSALQFKEPATNSSGYSFTLIPNTTPWNENNATINLIITNVGDLEGNFTIQFKCDSPITMKDSSQATTKVTLQAGESINLSIDVTSELFTQQITSHCYTNVTISSAPLWSTTDKQFYQAQPIVVDHGYFVNRCLAAFHEPFIQINSVNHTVFGLTTDSNGQNILQSTVTLKITNTGSTFSNFTIELTPKDNNCPFATSDIFKNQILNSGDHMTLTFTIRNEATTTSTIFGNMANNLLYYMFLNVTTNNKYDCWSTIGKDISYNFNFTVDSTCPTGFTGSSCNIPICFDYNAADNTHVCNGHGQCIAPNQCLCDNDYIGTNCSIPVCFNIFGNDTSFVCSGHGSCIANNTCICNAQYSGLQCNVPICYDIVATNTSNVCNGRGSCNSPNNCTCNSGYTGDRCELIVCNGLNTTSSNICSGHGNCVNPDTCQCDVGYTGNNCQYIICNGIASNSSTICSGNGDCISPNTCSCNVNYIGTNCEIPTCNNIAANETTIVCSGHGPCNSPNNCTCNTGYTGDNCEHAICNGVASNETTTVCNGHGSCNAPNNCQCHSGYVGDNCEFTICNGIASNHSNICSGNGNCISPNNCSCHNGYTGNNCEFSICNSIPANETTIVCSGHGQCNSPNNCTCNQGYTGDNCEHTICNGIASNETTVCSGHGHCNNPNNCTCNNGYTGTNCELTLCFGLNTTNTNVCSGNGNCTNPDTCQCNQGFTGPNCQFSICNGVASNETTVCSNHGNCNLLGECECTSLWSGINCENPVCFGLASTNSSVCSNHGSCSAPNTCQCNVGYFGNTCSDFNCNGKLHNATDVCNSNGNCIAPETCFCTPSYTGSNCDIPICFGKNATDRNVCNNNGTCIAPNTCVCLTEVVNNICLQSVCYGIEASNDTACSGNGYCIAPDTCACNQGYSGTVCNDYFCNGILFNSSSVCNGNGNCTQPNICDCKEGYFGDQCQTPSCFNILGSDTTNVCNGKGICSSYDHCVCNVNYFGNDCNVTICNGQLSNDTTRVCSGRGNCISPNNCACNVNYSGNNCEYPTCNGIASNETTIVCSGHGNCNAPNNCQCHSGYVGYNCEFTICNGIASNHSNVCSGNGNCISPNNCQCHNGFVGSDCEFPICNSIPANETTIVCSGHGQCNSPNNCTCNQGYTGNNCELPVCYGSNATYSNVCNGHGNCVNPDTCQCQSGYTGPHCEFTICNGIPSNETTLVCNGNGNCITPNSCHCNNGYQGINCESIIECTNNCSNHGICVNGACQCNVHYEGNLCETTTCYGVNSTLIGNVCNGHGICSSFDNCTCSNGYTGAQCDTLIINNNNNECIGNCSNHGMCQNGNCICLSGYSGNFCEFTTCYGTNSSLLTTVCSGHGTCSGFNNCTCSNGYTGNNCEIVVDDNNANNGCLNNNCSSRGTCNHGSCVCDNNYSGNTCEFTTCFGTNSSSISVCSGHGICTSFNNCTCISGYTGSTCNEVINVVVIDCPNNCSSKGTCNTNTGECLCNAGYSGNECQFTTCFGTNSSLINVCNNHGVCTSFNNCTCSEGYTGQQCDQLVNNNGGNNNNICNGNCSNHGMCQNGNCVCDNGYDGTICQFTTCYGVNSSLPTVCSNHGTCSSYNNCTCLNGYTGNNCETLIEDNNANNGCLNNNCSSRGTCNHGSCLCDNGYSGNTCEFTTCFGTNSSLSSVCSGHGVCTSFNNCTCSSGYTGSTCSEVINKKCNNNNNCNDKGTCVNGQCVCNVGYNGDFCQFTTCFGVNSSSINVCNGNGTCNGFNMCNCNDGYFGEQCEKSTCQENCKHGTCIAESQQQSSQPFTCKCNEGWIGEYCNIQNFTCFGINPTSSKVCSGRGTCIGLDKCNCTDPTIYSGPSCETKQYSATDCQFNNFNLEFTAKEWFKSQSIQITPTSVKSGTIIPITIPFTHFLSTQSIFQFHFNFKNSLKNNRLFKYEIITTCLDNGGSFYSLGRVVKNGEFRNSQNIILEDPSYGFGFSFKENNLNNDNPFLENIYCPITIKLTPTNLLNECYQYDKLNTNLNNNNNLNTNLNNLNNYYLYNTTLKFENINTCQFLKESDLEQIIPTRQTLFNLIDTTLEEDIYQWHNDQQLKLQQELNNNNNDTNIVITKVFKEKNNWNVIQASNYTIDATLLMTAEILNTNHQFGTFIPILYCKDERIHDGSDFFINHNNNYIILNELQDKVTFQFNITITNITANIIYPKLRGGQEGLANIEVNDLDLNCLLLTIPYPQSCWKSTTTTTTTATTTTATTTTVSKRNVNVMSSDKKVAGTTIIPYLNIKFKTNIKLPPLIGDYKFIQPVQAFEIGIVVVTYSVLSIGFASVFICSKIPRDRDFVMIQFANFVKDKLNRKKLQTAQELLAKKEEEEDHVPLCENCGHGSEKLSKYLIEVESNQRRPVRFYVCENQYCFDALSSLYNRNYREYFKCYNAITKQLMIDKEEIPFYVNKIDILDMPQISSHAITVNPNQTDLTHEVEGQTKVSKYWKENEWSRHAGLNVPIGLNEQLEDLEEENQLMNSNGYHYEDDGVVNYSGNNYGGNGYNNNNNGGGSTTTLSSSSPYVPYRAFTNAKIREVKEVNVIDYAALMEEEF